MLMSLKRAKWEAVFNEGYGLNSKTTLLSGLFTKYQIFKNAY